MGEQALDKGMDVPLTFTLCYSEGTLVLAFLLTHPYNVMFHIHSHSNVHKFHFF